MSSDYPNFGVRVERNEGPKPTPAAPSKGSAAAKGCATVLAIMVFLGGGAAIGIPLTIILWRAVFGG